MGPMVKKNWIRKIKQKRTYVSLVSYTSQDIFVDLQTFFLVTFRESFFYFDKQLMMFHNIHHFLKVSITVKKSQDC